MALVTTAVVTAVSSLLLAAVAIFGDSIRRKLYRPNLVLKLHSDIGSRINLTSRTGGQILMESRWFHIEVTNTARSFPFHDVKVNLIEICGPSQDGQFQSLWTGSVPTQWQHEPVSEKPFSSKTVGPACMADVCYIKENGDFGLNLVRTPNNVRECLEKRILFADRLKVKLVFQAVSHEGDSSPLAISINWNKVWHSADSEFRNEISTSTETI